MSRSNPDRSRRATAVLRAESLETRALLTGGVGNTFALVPGEVVTPGGSAEVRFTIDPSSFARPQGRMVLGIDVTGQTNSTIEAKVNGIKAVGGGPAATAAARRASLPLARFRNSTAALTTIPRAGRTTSPAATFALTVQARGTSQGAFVVGYYLPGDADGNGVVEQADTNAVKAALGMTVDDAEYNFDADGNRDGVINAVDLSYTRVNRGVRTTVSPVLSANLDSASDTGVLDRITSAAVVKFDGVATPGATVTYTEIAGKVPAVSVQAGVGGTYSINVPLVEGVNTFRVSSTDSFGQQINGQISPVTRRT